LTDEALGNTGEDANATFIDAANGGNAFWIQKLTETENTKCPFALTPSGVYNEFGDAIEHDRITSRI